MIPSVAVRTSRTTYRGKKGSGAGASSRTAARSSPFSTPAVVEAQLAGRTFKASQRGLYHGVLLQSGNNVPNSRQKTARTWRPNVQRKRLYSEILGRDVRVKTTTRAMRTMRKVGGLDAYVARTSDERLGAYGRTLRDRLGRKLKERAVSHVKLQPPKSRHPVSAVLLAPASARLEVTREQMQEVQRALGGIALDAQVRGAWKAERGAEARAAAALQERELVGSTKPVKSAA